MVKLITLTDATGSDTFPVRAETADALARKTAVNSKVRVDIPRGQWADTEWERLTERMLLG